MSARQIKRLQALQEEREKESVASSEIDAESDEEEDQQVNAKPKVNLFALLGDEEEDDDDDDEDSDKAEAEAEAEKIPEPEIEEESVETSEIKQPLEVKETLTPVVDSETEDVFEDAKEEQPKPKKKNKKKKKKSKKKKNSSDTAKLVTLEDADDDDEFETFGIKASITNKATTAEIIDPTFSNFSLNDFKDSLSYLEFNVRDLDPDNEYKQLFGHISAKVLNEADSTTSSFVSPEMLNQIKTLSKRIPGWGGRDRRGIPGSTRKLTLTKIRDDWIPTRQKNITMKELSTNEVISFNTLKNESEYVDLQFLREECFAEFNTGIRYFNFVNNINETLVNSQFLLSVVIRPDHEFLIKLIQQHPYHVESILQVSNILVRQGDRSNNSGLVERALFVFDRALKANFNLGSGLCRLPFEGFLNRQFYLAIFKYIAVLTQKGTFATSLAFTKLLWSFAPAEDPYGVRYFIDFYCVMSGNYQYLIGLCSSPLITRYRSWLTPGLAYSLGLAYRKLGKLEEAQDAVAKAFAMYPYLALELLETVCKQPLSTLNAVPTALINEIYRTHVSDAIKLANQTYLVRAPGMWKSREDIDFLGTELLKHITNQDSVSKLQGIKDLQSSGYESIPRNLLRYAILSGENGLMAKIPAAFWNDTSVYEYDALPPQNKAAETFESMIDDNFISEALLQESQQDMIDRLEAMGIEGENN
ncbi:Rqc1 protein [Saccharomycopsis crataegensis]|uniref:Rqc1 protein n=1 Tax=Saccharomycopsis crataegensis TaxID=43959 RepID=A0AAV5QDB1_9ASCO|nr:Rqc1 protein [Saccharomycopsis crataegensis]